MRGVGCEVVKDTNIKPTIYAPLTTIFKGHKELCSILEVDYLIELRKSGFSNKEISKLLNRTEIAINQKYLSCYKK